MTCRLTAQSRSIGSEQPLSGGVRKLRGWRTQSSISHPFGPCCRRNHVNGRVISPVSRISDAALNSLRLKFRYAHEWYFYTGTATIQRVHAPPLIDRALGQRPTTNTPAPPFDQS